MFRNGSCQNSGIYEDKSSYSKQILGKIRERIAQICEAESPFKNGEIELDESYFGARRVRRIRGRGDICKTPVFGMLKCGDKVYTQIVKNCSMSELMPIIKGKTDKHYVIYTDGFKTYNGLANYGYKKHYRVNHGENDFAKGRNRLLKLNHPKVLFTTHSFGITLN